MPPEYEPVAVLIHRAANALGEEAGLHIDLAMAEMRRDAEAFGRDVVPLAAGVLLLGIGYTFICATLAIVISPWLGLAGGVAVLSFLNLLLGGIAVRRSLTRLRARHILEATVGEELERSARSVASALQPAGPATRMSDAG